MHANNQKFILFTAQPVARRVNIARPTPPLPQFHDDQDDEDDEEIEEEEEAEPFNASDDDADFLVGNESTTDDELDDGEVNEE